MIMSAAVSLKMRLARQWRLGTPLHRQRTRGACAALMLPVCLAAVLTAGCALHAKDGAGTGGGAADRTANSTANSTANGAAGSAALHASSPAALADAMARQPIVLLGEVHDNAAQHALRAQALQRLVERGARPAIAFEQIDRDRQGAIDAIRADATADLATRAERIVTEAGAKGWDWALYRPYIVIALQNGLPIVGANLSRAQAMRVATEGYGAVFDASERAALGLENVAPDIERAQEYEIERGHCGQLPADSLPAMAGAQIARDAVLAQSISPYAARGVVLLTGNGHARRDIGVLRHLAPRDQEHVVAIGLLEDDGKAADHAGDFDAIFVTPVQARPDPCGNFHHTPVPPAPGIGTR